MPLSGERTPEQRSAGLVVKCPGRWVLIYDLTDHQATRLNDFAATVRNLCDGPGDLAALTRDTLKKLVAGAALAGPIVITLTVPTAVQAVSCITECG